VCSSDLGYCARWGWTDPDGNKIGDEPIRGTERKTRPFTKPSTFIATPVFDGANWDEEEKAGKHPTIQQIFEGLNIEGADGNRLIGVNGKQTLYNGRTGEPYDNPITTGFVDETTRTLFTSDCFGALLSGPADSAADVSADELREGQVRWATIDSSWVHDVDRDAFGATLDRYRSIAPDLVLSSHLPPAPGALLDTLVDALALVPAADRFVGPDQVMLDAMLAGMPAAATV